MPHSGYHRLQQAIKERARKAGKALKKAFTPREATEEEADTVLGPHRDPLELKRRQELKEVRTRRK